MYEQRMCVTADKIYFMISPLSTLVPRRKGRHFVEMQDAGLFIFALAMRFDFVFTALKKVDNVDKYFKFVCLGREGRSP